MGDKTPREASTLRASHQPRAKSASTVKLDRNRLVWMLPRVMR